MNVSNIYKYWIVIPELTRPETNMVYVFTSHLCKYICTYLHDKMYAYMKMYLYLKTSLELKPYCWYKRNSKRILSYTINDVLGDNEGRAMYKIIKYKNRRTPS